MAKEITVTGTGQKSQLPLTGRLECRQSVYYQLGVAYEFGPRRVGELPELVSQFTS